MNLLKDNWLRIILAIVLVVIGASMTFCYLSFLANKQENDNDFLKHQWLSERKRQCSVAAKIYAERKKNSDLAYHSAQPLNIIYNLEKDQCIAEIKFYILQKTEYEYHLIDPESEIVFEIYWYDYAKKDVSVLSDWGYYRKTYKELFGEFPVLGK